MAAMAALGKNRWEVGTHQPLIVIDRFSKPRADLDMNLKLKLKVKTLNINCI